MSKQRGLVQCQAAILQTLEAHGPMNHSELRRRVGMRGSTIYRHLNNLLEQKLITEWFKPRSPYQDLHYYNILNKGRKALKQIQFTFDILGLPDLRSMEK